MVEKIINVITFFRTSKKFKNYLMFILTAFFMLSSSLAFAETPSEVIQGGGIKLDVQMGYEEQGTFTSSMSDDDKPNVLLNRDNMALSALTSVNMTIAPQAFTGYERLQASNASPWTKNGFIGTMENSIVSLYENQPSANLYAHLGQEWVPGYNPSVSSTYAANDGYDFLMSTGIDGLWNIMRTIAYIFFVVVLIIAGFMIMFRQKIGGQVAVTLFNALPGVIIGLILVTFSFAIVGLLLNFSVLITNVIGSFLVPGGQNPVTVDQPWSLLFNVGQLANSGTVGIGLGALVTTLVTAIVALLVVAAPATAGTTLVIAAGVAIGAPILLMVFVLAGFLIILYASIRVYITLLSAFLGIVLDTILAPIFLAISSLPGQEALRSSWLKRLLKNALTFPVVFLFLNLGLYIFNSGLDIRYPTGLTSGSFANQGTGDDWIGWLLKTFIVIGMWFFAADAPKILSDFIPTKGGEGAAAAVAGFRGALGKIPLVGSMLGGK